MLEDLCASWGLTMTLSGRVGPLQGRGASLGRTVSKITHVVRGGTVWVEAQVGLFHCPAQSSHPAPLGRETMGGRGLCGGPCPPSTVSCLSVAGKSGL